jgi:elongator complex protein 1
VVLPALLEAAEGSLTAIKKRQESLLASFKQFKEVLARRNRVGQVGDDDGGEGGVPADDSDLFSDTTSVATASAVGSAAGKTHPASLMTRASQRSKTSKNRRKNERKKYSTRAGGAHEDIGLMAEIHETVAAVYGSLADTGDLLRALVRTGKETLAAQLQTEMSTFLSEADKVCKEVWPDKRIADESGDGLQGGSRFGPNVTVADIVAGNTAAVSTTYTPPLHLLGKYKYPLPS